MHEEQGGSRVASVFAGGGEEASQSEPPGSTLGRTSLLKMDRYVWHAS